MSLSLRDIEQLYRQHGGEQYSGEPVSQIEHALQCGALAEAEGADDELVSAAFLHDLGHLLHDLGETPTLRGVDDVHQYRAVPFLRGVFSERVLNAIAMHVDAKRYLCATRADYHDNLSEDSRRSLRLQGGVFDTQQAQAFIATVGAADAVRVRVWDDRAKVAGLNTPPLDHYLQRMRRCALSGAGT